MNPIYNTNILYNTIYRLSIPYLPKNVETFCDPCVNNGIIAMTFIEKLNLKKIYLNDININNIIKLNKIFVDLPQITTTNIDIFNSKHYYYNMFDLVVANPLFERNINYNMFISNIVNSLTLDGIACIILPFNILKLNIQIKTFEVLVVVNIPTRKNIRILCQTKSPSKSPSKSSIKSPTKSSTKSPSKSSIKSPTKSSIKFQTPFQTPFQTLFDCNLTVMICKKKN
jgi:hypothetical protein